MKESLVLKEQGGPVEVALKVASKGKLLSEAKLAELRAELYDLVEEVTTTFIGFVAVKSVKKGLDMALAVIGLALEYETKGAYQPDVWIKLLDEKGFKRLSTRTIELFRKLAELPHESGFVSQKEMKDEFGSGDVKTQMKLCFQTEAKESAYAWYRSNLKARREHKLTREFVEWLLESKTGAGIDYWVEKLHKPDAEEPYVPELNGIINSMFMREAIGLVSKPYLTYDEALLAQRSIKTKGRKWVGKARERFTIFLSAVPERFRTLPIFDDWFDSKFVNQKPKFFKEDATQAVFHIISIPPRVRDKMMKDTAWEDERKLADWEKKAEKKADSEERRVKIRRERGTASARKITRKKPKNKKR
jgi:hypothetical protein